MKNLFISMLILTASWISAIAAMPPPMQYTIWTTNKPGATITGASVAGGFTGTGAGDGSGWTNFSVGTITPTNTYSQIILGSNSNTVAGVRQYIAFGLIGATNLIQMSGQASSSGSGGFTNNYVEIPNLVSSFTNRVQYGATISALTCIYTTPPGVTNIYEVGGNIVVTAISSGSIQPQVQFTDEKSNSRTANLTAAPQTTTGFLGFNSQTITCAPNTVITVQATVGGGTQTYDATGWVRLVAVNK